MPLVSGWLSHIALSIVAATAPAPTPSAQPPTPAKPGIAVVELFTSEGCNSCPPADRVFARLAAEAGPADHVYLLAWHVDYWDRLGWKDPFGLPEAGHRQREYQRVMSSRSEPGAGVYTPQAVVNGQRALVASDDGGVRARIAEALGKPSAASVDIAPLEAAKDGRLSLTAKIADAPDGADAVAVVVEDGLVSSVKAGENKGQTLRHARVVRAAQTLAGVGKEVRFTLSIPTDLKPEGARVVVFVQAKGLGPIVAAASVPLASPSAPSR